MKISKTLRRSAAALTFAAIASAFVVGVVAAQAPPNPPSRFVGNIVVDGSPATSGVVVEARIGGATCGATTVFMANGEARYALDSPAIDPTDHPNCGVDGSTVSFYVGGRLAAQTGSWANYQLNTVNLTVATAATPTAVPTAAATPVPPFTGDTVGGGASAAPALELMLVAAAIGLAGVGIASRFRKS
jgi:hypothetical protein